MHILKKMIWTTSNQISIIVLVLSIIIGNINYLFSGQSPQNELVLSAKNQDVLLTAFDPFGNGETPPLKRVIDNTHLLNLVNFYGNEPITDLWASITENQRPYTIILIIPGHTLLPSSSLDFLETTADECEANRIPYAIQNITGEVHNEEKLPITYLESRFAQRHEFFYGLNGAELYNGVTWRGEVESNNSQYIIDCINMVVKYGAFFLWTDTNMNYDSGMVLQWFQTNEAFYSAFKNNAANIVLMNKESYGTPSTYSVMQGLWLAGLVGNWGVASDWWHWQVDGDKKSLFGEGDQFVDDEWDVILSYPENMYVQSMMLVMSCGGTCFKAEAPNFSTSSGGIPIAGFQYGISPLLNSIISGQIIIPSKTEVLASTIAVVLGAKNYPEFNYNFKESNLYPDTGRYRILPLLPNNLRLAERAVFEDNGIMLVECKKNQTYYDTFFKQNVIGNTYTMRTGTQWYFINNVENERKVKSAVMTPVLCTANTLSIEAQEHTSAIITEAKDKLSFYISNYRTDKTNMIRTVTPTYRTGKNWIEVCRDFMILDLNGNPVGLDDSFKRTTKISIEGTLNAGEPQIVWLSNPDGSGYQNRPFTYNQTWDQISGTLTLTVNNNGVVKFDVLLDKSDEIIDAGMKTPIVPTLKTNNNSIKELQTYVKTLTVGNKSTYNEYSFMKFNAALEKARVIIRERTYSKTQIILAQINLENAFNNLLDISKYTNLLRMAKAIDLTGEPEANKIQLVLAIDALLRETLSNNVYVAGRSNKLEYSKIYKRIQFSKSLKVEALEQKYHDLLAIYNQFEKNIG